MPRLCVLQSLREANKRTNKTCFNRTGVAVFCRVLCEGPALHPSPKVSGTGFLSYAITCVLSSRSSMQFLKGIFLGALLGTLYLATIFLATTIWCVHLSGSCAVLAQLPLYLSLHIENLINYLSTLHFLHIPVMQSFQLKGITVTIPMLNTLFIFALLGGIFWQFLQMWSWSRVTLTVIGVYLFCVLAVFLWSIPKCPYLKYVVGGTIPIYACDPPKSGTKW